MKHEETTSAVAPPFERGVGRLVPERDDLGAPLCIWCERRLWGACKSRYDTLTCIQRLPDEAER